ncbi:MAG: MoxR family ATPase [Deltaproteobacteria bacterium]|nr:MoxR family ATPase [Deltaproteobacteria bacterium]
MSIRSEPTPTPTPTPSRREDEGQKVRTLALESVVRRISQVVRDKEDVVRLLMIGFLARGHVLIEDVPGVGKTTLARALARALGGTFRRVQLTSDLLPADILGGQVLDRQSGQLVFRPGPVFANIVLADELNRATPRTQSGLLEAMAERSVSIDGQTHDLPDPFMVIATQNPAEHHGTYPLPESQLDRFLVRTSVGYPGEEVERALLIAGSEGSTDAVDTIEPVLTADSALHLADLVDGVSLAAEVAAYIQAIVRATRQARELEIGVSTRGALLYARAARARALVFGRSFVTPDDVFALAVPVCAHRVVVRGARRASRLEAESILEELVSSVPIPT